MQLLFRPASIAVVGASADLSKRSGLAFHNLVSAGYRGRLYPVNPRLTELEGFRAYPSMLELPEAPDLVFVIVPAEAVAGVLEESGQRGVRVGLVGVSGFAESGEAGKARQEQLLEIARKYGMRLCGPNCNGVYNVLDSLPIGYNSSHAERLPAGGAAIIAQSAAMLGSLAHRAKRAGLGLSYLAGVGNEADWDMCDYLRFCLEDEATSAVGLLVEGLRDGSRFLDLADRARAAAKHIVALKLGRSERGAAMAQAHSARMAGTAEVYAAAFRQSGVIATDSLEAFLGALQMVSSQPVPKRGALMALSSSGAGAELIADKAEDYGVTLSSISDEVRDRFPRQRFAVSLSNPFETAGQSREPGFLDTVCSLFASDPSNDCLLLYLLELAARDDFAEAFGRAVKEHGKTGMAVVGEVGETTLEVLRRHGLPVFGSVDACFRALRAVTDAAGANTPHVPPPPGHARGRAFTILAEQQGGFLPEGATKRLLAEYELASAEAVLVPDLPQAKAAAQRMGFPVILKATTSRLVHKAQAGLVSSRLDGDAGLEDAYAALQLRAPGPLSVEQFIPHEFEAMLGIKHDPVFGPVIVFGLGGVFTEVVGDYSVRLAARLDPGELLTSIKLYPLLQRANVDLAALTEAIRRLGTLALDLEGHLVALDVNPVALLQDRVVVLDAKAELIHTEDLS